MTTTTNQALPAAEPAPAAATQVPPATAPAFVRALNPLIRRLLGAGMPMGPNTLLTVRGRRTGQLRTFPVGVFEVDGRRFVMGSFGETNWIRNLRASGEATIRAAGVDQPVQAIELSPEDAAPVLRRTLARFLARRLMAPMLRSWYGVDANSTDADFLARAREHPMFELIPVGASSADHDTEGRAA
jgi:deazaflavin-dependent oxidoreductase (nitroreductase family)